jgi:hypothetical protein
MTVLSASSRSSRRLDQLTGDLEVNVAMGLDDKTINDDEDAVMELRTQRG